MSKPTRNVYLADEITPTSAGQVIGWLLALDIESHEPIRLFVKSIGGEWEEGRRICDTILYQIKSPVITIAVHHADSAAAPIVNCGVIRLGFRQTKFMYHKIGKPIEADEVGARWYLEDLLRYVSVYTKANDEYLSYCVKRRGTHLVRCVLNVRSLRYRIKKAKEGEYTIDAREAKKLGLVDAIIKSVDDIQKFEALISQAKGGVE